MTHYCRGAIEEGPLRSYVLVQAHLTLVPKDRLRILHIVKDPQRLILWERIADPIRIGSLEAVQ